MPIPDYQTIMRPLLFLVKDAQKPLRQCVEEIANQFDLTEEERNELIPSGKTKLIYSRVHWAATYMVQAKLLSRPKRGVIIATDRGREALKQNPDQIDNDVLSKFPEFVEFKNRSRSGSSEEKDTGKPLPPDEDEQTPEERISSAAEELNVELRDEILSRIQASNPTFFEHLIIDMMLAMGYGGSGSGQHLGKTADGGVDGIINEDPLGLDIVFLQAKRYAENNVIGVQQIREFAGSLDEKGATKGVFVTTSRFAKPAIEYAERSPKRLILIDGDKLTRLLIQYGVGVRAYRTVKLSKLDEDYFAAADDL